MASDLASSTDQLPRVAIIMGSRSDWPTMQHSAKMLDALQVGHKALVVSAHRTPDRLYSFAKSAKNEGFGVIIAGAGGAARRRAEPCVLVLSLEGSGVFEWCGCW